MVRLSHFCPFVSEGFGPSQFGRQNSNSASISGSNLPETTHSGAATVPSHFCCVSQLYCAFTAIDTLKSVSTIDLQLKSKGSLKNPGATKLSRISISKIEIKPNLQFHFHFCIQFPLI